MPLFIALAAFLSAFFGGLFALRFKDRLHLILGFSAGTVIGVAFFDLIPESIALGKDYSVAAMLSLSAVGFALYMILDRMVILHRHSEEDDGEPAARSKLGAGSLITHSFLDGMAIGLAFKVSPSVGAIVAAAVLTHGFSDGINTVNLILKGRGKTATAWRWLLADGLAPVAGIAATYFFTLAESTLGIALALFAGFFLYLGASDLLPESHHAHPTAWTTFATVLGMGAIYLAVTLAGA